MRAARRSAEFPQHSSNSNPRRLATSSVKKYDSSNDDQYEHIFRRVRGILNKLTPERFDKLCLELLNVGITSEPILRGIITLIFNKAIDEPRYSALYAQLCLRLAIDTPNFDHQRSTNGESSASDRARASNSSFRRWLLSKCQDEFENRSRATNDFDKAGLTDEELQRFRLAKRKMLGNIKFIGELGKLEVVQENILHMCIKQLLDRKRNIGMADMAEDIECLCQILNTIGQRLDHEKAKGLMDQYFARIHTLAGCQELPSRIRFLLQDVIELRANRWIPRKAVLQEQGPTTIQHIREAAAGKDSGYSMLASSNGMGLHMNGHRHGEDAACSGDLFTVPMSGRSIGTGPGVIQDGPRYFGGNPATSRPRSPSTSAMWSGRSGSKEQRQQPSPAVAVGNAGGLPPRFHKRGHQNGGSGDAAHSSVGGGDDVSLRPVVSFHGAGAASAARQKKDMAGRGSGGMQRYGSPAFRGDLLHGGEYQHSGSDRSLNGSTNPFAMQKPLPIKAEKQKTKKPAAVLSVEELDKHISSYLDLCSTLDCLSSSAIATCASEVKGFKLSQSLVSHAVSSFMMSISNKPDNVIVNIALVISSIKASGVFTTKDILEGLSELISTSITTITPPDADVDESSKEGAQANRWFCFARLASELVAQDSVTLAELSHLLRCSGSYGTSDRELYPAMLLALQHLATKEPEAVLAARLSNGRVNIRDFILDSQRSGDEAGVVPALDKYGIGFLAPAYIRYQSAMWSQLQAEPMANALFKWIKQNIDEKAQADVHFIRALMTVIIKFVVSTNTAALPAAAGGPEAEAANKVAAEQEKSLLEKFKSVLQRFLHDSISKQKAAVYAVQVFCCNLKFPKGLLLRLFMHLYDMEIVDEEAFLEWKEEVNEEYPGKGPALFQVNHWLTWLEQADEESDDEDNDIDDSGSPDADQKSQVTFNGK